MDKSEKFQKVSNGISFSESVFALTGVISVLAITTFALVMLNPKPDRTLTEGKVAGVNEQLADLDFINLYRRRRHEVEFKKDLASKTLTYSIAPKSTGRGILLEDLVQVSAKNPSTINLEVATGIEGYVIGDLDLYLVVGEAEYKIFDRASGPVDQNIKIDVADTQIIKLKYDAAEQINFLFKVNIEIKY